MLHLGIEPLITNLMMLSLAPKARRRLGTELTEGPLFDLDVKLRPEDRPVKSGLYAGVCASATAQLRRRFPAWSSYSK